MRTAIAGLAVTLASALALVPTTIVAQDSTKIGFVGTFSGPAAAIGNDMRDAFELALDHLGRKVGGLPVNVIYEDDQQKPEVGKQKTDKLIGADRVNFLTGYIWSNVLLASLKPAADAETFLISANAGPSQIAGEQCSPWFFSVSWQGDQVPQAIGEYLNQKGVKSAFLIAPNYAAGKDVVAGLKANFKGTVAGEEYTKWPDQLDFSVELAKARAAKPDAVFAFYPGAAGVQFLTQYAQAGLKGQIPLYTAFVVDALSLPRLNDLAVGVPGAQHWVNDQPNEANKKFVADFRAKYNRYPSFYAAPTTRPC
jgi:branched-chain amino acid transport system substrate-binding protein